MFKIPVRNIRENGIHVVEERSLYEEEKGAFIIERGRTNGGIKRLPSDCKASAIVILISRKWLK